MDGAGKDGVWSGQFFQFARDALGFREQRGAFRFRCVVGEAEQQRLAFLHELFLFAGRLRDGRDAVGEVRLAPARRGFDRVERSDGLALRDIFPTGVEDLQLGEREDEVVFARRKFCRGHADVAARDSVVLRAAGGEWSEAGVWKIGHEGRVVLAPEQRHVALEFRVVARLDLEAHGKSEACADGSEVVVARQQRDVINRRGRAEIHLHPLRRILLW